MKNLKLLLSITALFSAFYVNAQQNLIWNGDFEETGTWATTFPEGTRPVDWDEAMYCAKETAICFGTAACKMTGNANAKLVQNTGTISGLTAGDTYQLSFKYYVVTSAGSADIDMRSFWGSSGSTHDEAVLKEQFSAAQVGQWETKTLTTTVPSGSGIYSFTVSVKVPNGAVVIFDDFDFHKTTTAPTEPTITISPSATQTFSTTINNAVTKTVTVTTANLPNAATISFGGANAAFFSALPVSVPANASTQVTITYLPTAAGSHTANMVVDYGGNLSASSNNVLYLSGSATDPSLVPTVEILPVSHNFHDTEIGKRDTAEFTVTSANIPSSTYLGVRLVNANGRFWIVGSNSVQKNTQVTVKVEFIPNAETVFNAQLEIYDQSIGNAPSLASASLTGTGLAATSPPQKEGDDYPLDDSNPLAQMNEEFNSVSNNQPVSIPQWKNIAEQNLRAWRGHKFDNNNFAVKATAYDLINTAPDAYEMRLYTPPLDFVNAQSKVFTFRVMGDIMSDEMAATLEVYYVKKDENRENGVFREKIEMEIPQGDAYRGVWVPYILDFTGQNLNDVFFIEFRFFVEHGGNQNSVVYYIDDVTWGIHTSAVNEIPDNSVVAWAKDGKIFISSENSGSAALYNIAGVMLENYDFSHGISEFPADFSAGIYLLKIKGKTCKIVIK